jgi:AcrR family transcriptional regulator
LIGRLERFTSRLGKVTVTDVAESNTERLSRRQVDKFAERRTELADAALRTLAELGYARTSLREIAQNSEFSHGVLHYYFRDKVELITHCVRQYKAECVKRYDVIVDTAQTAAELEGGFGNVMADTLRNDARLHRLWYDMRNQSMFEAVFRPDVAEIDRSLERMIWRIVSRYSTLAERPAVVTSPTAYALFDGLFQQALFRFLDGDEQATTDLRTNTEIVLRGTISPA